jgi:prepilin-type N-terminal cleavage/methylation domain-containing protein
MKASINSADDIRGLTLLEMVVVVAVLAVVAGLISFNLTPDKITISGVGNNETAAAIATRSTMKAIKGAILGNDQGPGYWNDMNKDWRLFPVDLSVLFIGEARWCAINGPFRYSPSDASATNLWTYNAKTKLGCRFPYLEASGHYLYGSDATNRYFTTSLFRVGLQDSPCPTDGWGNPIVLLVPAFTSATDAKNKIQNNVCLISAGPNGILDSNSPAGQANPRTYTDFLTARTYPLGNTNRFCQDDIVVFLFQPDLP